MAPALVVPKPPVTPTFSSRTSTSKTQNQELSLPMTVILVFIIHSSVNAALLSPWNSIRCAYWNLQTCTSDQNWMLNWLCFAQFHVCALLWGLAYKARGIYILEQRLVTLCTALMTSILSIGVFMLDHLNHPMAGLQAAIYLTLLGVLAFHTATAPPVIGLPPAHVRSSSFDRRRKLPIATVAVGIQAILSMMRLLDMTFGSGRGGEAYLGGDDVTNKAIYQSMSNAAVTLMGWIALILGASTVLATVEQQKALLVGQVLVLFVSQIMLSGSQGERIDDQEVKAGGIGTFFSILIALTGAC